MAYIIETPNAFQPLVGLRKWKHPGGCSIRRWLEDNKGPDFKDFHRPTICLVNGSPVMREWPDKEYSWDREIRRDDIVNFVTVVAGWVEVIIIAVVLILAVVLALTLGVPATPGETPASDPVFSTKGQVNAIRLGEPIEVNYGRNRIYPSLASRPFFQYRDNDQFQHSLFCIGQGKYEIETIQVGDTDIDNFQEVQYEVLEPGEQTTLFRTNIVTSVEAGGQTLFASNEPEFTAPGWIGPFTTNPAGTTTDKIEVDITYPKGLYKQTKDGKIWNASAPILFEKRLINDVGTPLSAFSTLFSDSTPARTTTPQRRTFSTVVTAGRYEVRGMFVGTKKISTRVGNTAVWEGMRGYIIGEEPDFGDVTLLAVVIKATNNLNARTQERFNVIATRKLPVRDSSGGGESNGGFTEPVTTRSIVWAFVDVFRANYGAKITDEIFFDFDMLEELDALYESRNEHFDWTFRDPITVWEAARTIARVGRAVPLLVGSLITMKRDGPLEVPVTLFNPDNMIKGSFQWDIKLWEPNEVDAISVEYTDVTTGYKQEHVLCQLPDSDQTAENVEDIRIPGIQDRDHAYHEGLYILASKKYLRENITFETGMEGFIPSYGDLVVASHDVPRWGQSGYILDVEDQSGDTFVLHVSEPLRFEDTEQYVILLRDKAGAVLGPFNAIEIVGESKQVEVSISESDVDFLLTGRTEPMLFLFGTSNEEGKYGRVVKIEPQGGERIRIVLVNESAIIHSFDSLEAPALSEPSLPPVVPDLPEILSLVLSNVDGGLLIIQASWTAAFGAQYYTVQISYDDEFWQNMGETVRTSMQMQVQVGLVRVRVAAVNNGQGPWIQEEITVGMVSGLLIFDAWDCLEFTVKWWPKNDVDGWVIRIYDNTESAPVLMRTALNAKTALEYTYTHTMALADGNLNRSMIVSVDARVLDDETLVVEDQGFPTEILLENVIPPPPFNLVATLVDDSVGHVYHLEWDNPPTCDLYRVKVFISVFDISAFDEDEAELVFDSTAGTPGYLNVDDECFITIDDESDSGHALYFWWVAVFDIWGNEITSNISDPGTIFPAMPTPTNLTIVDNTTFMEMSWDDNSLHNDHYEVHRKTGAGAYDIVFEVYGGNANYFIDNTVVVGLTYTYKVRAAYNAPPDSVSDFSNEDTDTVLP